ncbi:MAG: L-threonylcarbamoyladenylate synthase [Patescibacteria group bacterium]
MTTRKEITKILKSGGIGVMPTDTIYGLLGRATNKKTVERIYRVRHRSPEKPLIIIISSLADLNSFGIKLPARDKKVLLKIWPNAVSVILPCMNSKFKYLHRGTKSLAFRLPNKKWLRDLVAQTGPLVAPSANPEGESPADDIKGAKKYFGDNPDFYYGRGKRISLPSTLIGIKNGQVEVLRQGKAKIER